MKMSQMKEDQKAHVCSISIDTDIARRLFDMGLSVGKTVVCTNIAALGSPIAYEFCGSKIAIRKKDADEIGVIL